MVSAETEISSGLWRLPLPSATLPPYDHTNSYLVASGGAGVLIGAGSDDTEVLRGLYSALDTFGVTLTALMLTHAHPDHCAGAAAVAERYDVPVFAHPLEQSRLDFSTQPLHDSENVTVGTSVLRALHTPGHSPGHLSFFLPHARRWSATYLPLQGRPGSGNLKETWRIIWRLWTSSSTSARLYSAPVTATP